MKINYTKTTVAYVAGALPSTIHDVLTRMDASMEDSTEGTGQYPIEDVMERFDIESEEWAALNDLAQDNIDYIEA